MALGIWILYISIDGLVTGSWARSTRGFAYFLIPVGVALVLLGAWFLIAAMRPAVVLTAESLRIRRGAFRTLDVPVHEITGVGLVFKRFVSYGGQRPPAGWYLTVWHGDAQDERVGIAYAPALWRNSGPHARAKLLADNTPAPAPGTDSRFSLKKFDPASETDTAKLAATHAGEVAAEIYQQVLAQQGPTGLLAVTEQQKHLFGRGGDVLASWSPDGFIGRPGLSASPPTAGQNADHGDGDLLDGLPR